MSHSLKDFVNANREQFDDKTPRASAWGKIEAALNQGKTSWWNSVTMWRAAAIILFGVSGYLLGTHQSKPTLATRQLSSEFKDLDAFYNDQIIEKAEMVSQFQRERGEGDDEVTQNLQKLEAMYQVLKEQMKKRPTQDVKDALVLNLLVRIDLLNQQLKKLDTTQPEKEQPSENV
ncbi:MAG: hypothetical protein ACK514_10785 [Bacteroidota bacterium]|jgi:hypothetical protein|nr:hypothetical protein [Cytophagales bacterium]MCE2959062.1 hypothetical protein [Flammeovirgaceae bacterium]MCZ8070803.1 hypothetical protein [Cytophagales bacterium]